MKTLAATLVALLLLTSCGDDAVDEFTASCTVSRSEMGPFGPDEKIGGAMSAEAAQAQLEATGYDEWIEITADGTWDDGWEIATRTLGQSIHQEISWFDVDGILTDLYEDGDAFEFTDVRVSRSFQGKIEHADEPLFIGVDQSLGEANFDAGCEVTAVRVGDPGDDDLLDIYDAIAFPVES